MKNYQSFLHVFLKYTQNNREYIEYDPLRNSNSSSHARADTLNSLFFIILSVRLSSDERFYYFLNS